MFGGCLHMMYHDIRWYNCNWINLHIWIVSFFLANICIYIYIHIYTYIFTTYTYIFIYYKYNISIFSFHIMLQDYLFWLTLLQNVRAGLNLLLHLVFTSPNKTMCFKRILPNNSWRLGALVKLFGDEVCPCFILFVYNTLWKARVYRGSGDL